MIPYIHRDISWLAFNYRVLQEAMDKSVPLFERLRFLAIYSSNLDEFYKVRVANHRNLIRAGNKTKAELDFEPEVVMERIHGIVNEQQLAFTSIFKKELVPELKEYGINIVRPGKLKPYQAQYVTDYFNEKMLPFVQPVLLVGSKVKPFLNTGALYFAIEMKDKETDSKKMQYAIVKIPSDHLPRFITLPTLDKSQHDVMFLDDAVRYTIKEIFPGYSIKHAYSIKLTRDAELYIDDEYDGDLIVKIKKSLDKRNVGVAARLVYDREMPDKMLNYLMKVFDLKEYDLLPEGRYHNNSDFFSFPTFGMDHLLNNPLPPLKHEELENAENIFDEIAKKDHFVMPPFHSYESVIKFFEDASKDPYVTHIKIIQYRVASSSRIMKALMKAVQIGKQVTVFVEVKARFDEKANLQWGEKLEAAGVTVHYSMPGLKVHSKTAIVRRTEGYQPVLYCYLSTGNFHERTAKIYSDMGIFTKDIRLTSEAARMMTYLETKHRPEQPFEHMAVGQFNLKPMIIEKINREVEHVKNGKEGHIILKMNSITDEEMVNTLYEASKQGVKIQMIVRGICSLVPGIKGFSENIEAISIVDRFLEHARVFVFNNAGDKEVYLSSADWMVRNLHRRVETVFPVFDQDVKKRILDIIDIQLKDNQKARYIDFKNNNTYKRNDTNILFRSQVETYYYIKRLEDSIIEEKQKEEDL